MAKAPNVQAAAFVGETTAAAVQCTNMRFEGADGQENTEFITQDMDIVFNGVTDRLGDRVTYARTATTNAKNNAVKARVNILLGASEPGVQLNNTQIQVSGLPI